MENRQSVFRVVREKPYVVLNNINGTRSCFSMATFLVIFFSRILSLPAQLILGRQLKLRACTSSSGCSVFCEGDKNPQALKILSMLQMVQEVATKMRNKICFLFHGGNSLHVHLTSPCLYYKYVRRKSRHCRVLKF